MSKIICDVCGTSYPETATQCPICGCVRPGDVVTVSGNTQSAEGPASGTYTYVKGGRFSKANVKKRNQAKFYQPEDPQEMDDEPQEGGSNKGLVVAVVLLLLAIVAVVAYIAIRLFGPGFQGTQAPETTGSTVPSTSVAATTEAPTESTAAQIPCVDIVISKSEIRFEKAGAAFLLDVTMNPGDTTDVLEFTTSDEKIATVTQGGKVTSVAPGEATITALCGNAVAQCTVICDFEEEQKETTAPPVEESEFVLNREDFTMSKKGDQWKLYSGEIPDDQIQWSSDDESVVTVKNGVVTAVGKGMTTVHATYGSVKLSCIVRCADSVGDPEEAPAQQEQTPESGFSISATDVTIRVGEAFLLTLTDTEGQTVTVTWTPADTAVCSATDNTITGVAGGITTVTTVHDGVTYSCIVRVSG